MKYTIKGKDYSELDIKKRCAELMGLSDIFLNPDTKVLCVESPCRVYDPCTNPLDTWPIIEKCWDELMEYDNWCGRNIIEWQFLMQKHRCSKLEAACICLIDIKEQDNA